MAEFNDTYRKAGLLMQSALKKYAEGDVEGGDRDRKEANRLYDEAESQVIGDQTDISMLYGENRNFGIAYKVFESNTAAMFKDKERKKDITKVLKLIKEDKNLMNQFKVYDMLANKGNAKYAKEYVNEAISLIPKFNKNSVIKSNEKLIGLIRKLKLDEMVTLTDEEMNLYESIEYLMFNKKSLDNLNEYVGAEQCITEHVEKNGLQQKASDTAGKTMDEIYEESVNEMHRKYDETLTESEKHLVESILALEDKETYFNLSKKDAIHALNAQLSECCDEDNANSLKRILENVSARKYNESTVISDVAEFREIKETIIKEEADSREQMKGLIAALAWQCKNHDGSGTAVGDKERAKSELAYTLPSDLQQEEIFDDIEKQAMYREPKEVADYVIANIENGEYKGWWTTDNGPKVY